TALERDRELDAEPRGDGGALVEDPPQELDHLGLRPELAEGGAGERGDRIERGVADELQPDLVAQPLLDRRLQAAAHELGRDLAAAVADRAVRLAEREPRSLDVADDARRGDLGRAVDDAADHGLG